ncbi:putative cob(II)yrinic acid a,c-diamide reductase [Caenibius tardaugens NBRC 16725]|uniref:Putative cob(II)yrinic acid a,c-diamide reductase n=1 Tax=Caenibius tardaugens NBRC 16725 TaxID=1219035 RepID=U3A4I8_9SPHN|nr:5,6-dimethylbenzimidazole synthase [Caenibius tardaugens]AZI37769.1 5,6-dimethylbenzimidazole synthase [Caenibius tardaugens NBRC 16725]GAD49668.1 putative cob(II)yrinic acid a,c-diamide reductase [Caenibius tardaugens NBRC 16725]
MPETPPLFDASFQQQFGQLLRWRRDVRHFASQPVAEADMRTMLDCAALAPSVGHSQPWRFVRLRTPALRDRLVAHVDGANARAAERYAGDSRLQHYLSLKLHGLREAPELLAVYCEEQPEAGHGLGIATMPEMLRYSCVMAVHNLWLAARLRGIGVGWVSILDPGEVQALLDVPAHWSLIALLCIGYPVEESETPELELRGWQGREALADRVLER